MLFFNLNWLDICGNQGWLTWGVLNQIAWTGELGPEQSFPISKFSRYFSLRSNIFMAFDLAGSGQPRCDFIPQADRSRPMDIVLQHRTGESASRAAIKSISAQLQCADQKKKKKKQSKVNISSPNLWFFNRLKFSNMHRHRFDVPGWINVVDCVDGLGMLVYTRTSE